MVEQGAIQTGWVRGKIIEERKGYTVEMLKKDKQQGMFREGLHFVKDAKNRLWWNFEALDKHIENGMSLANYE